MRDGHATRHIPHQHECGEHQIVTLVFQSAADSQLTTTPTRGRHGGHPGRSVLVVVAEQGQVDPLGHCLVPKIVGMPVIAAVKRRENACGVGRIS